MADDIAKSMKKAFKKPEDEESGLDSFWDKIMGEPPAPLGKTVSDSLKRKKEAMDK